jgi:hypothetical protein
MSYRKKITIGLVLLFLMISDHSVLAQSDSMMIYRQSDLSKVGMNFYNFSKPEKFNFEVIVLGGVKSQGIYLLPEGTSLIELVALTGGSVDESIFDNFKLIRAKLKNPDLKADTVMVISYKDLFDKEKIGSVNKMNPLLKPGDIITFPIKPDKDFWDTAGKISTIFIIPLISAATLIVTIMNYNK